MTFANNREAIIALGANVGDRWENIQQALKQLEETPGIESVVSSPVFETAPVGFENQPAFLNLVAGIQTRLTPEELMVRLFTIEKNLGRRRTVRWGPRTIDLDLIFFAGETRNSPDLILPHPRWAERTFVTIPLRELLLHSPFQGESWETVREQVRQAPPDPDVRLWKP